jgi:diphthine-ammonia ligase
MNERRPIAAISWSGGKDSCTALHRIASKYRVVAALTMFDETGSRSRSHGLTPQLMAQQVARLGMRHVLATCTWDTYDAAFGAALQGLRADGVTHVVFGDIMFDENRLWAERMCAAAGVTAVEPIWGESSGDVIREFLEMGGEAMIVTARAEYLDQPWLGRMLTPEAVDELTRLGVDACGERGEYHTLVTNCPMFERPLTVRTRGYVFRLGCWALDLEVPDTEERPAPGH